jgi:alkylation response protein AidB-like acyl-CoA dehydrogenase
MLGIEPTEVEQLLVESVDRLVERDYPFELRRQAMQTELGFRPQIWSTFAELGWLGLLAPEAVGGFGGGARHCAILMEAFGRALVTEPYLASVVMAGSAIHLASQETQAETLLAEMVAGSRRPSLAYAEPTSRYDVNVVNTRAERSQSGWRINGRKSVVLNGDSADCFIVSARSAGADSDEEGISLFTIDAGQEGVAVRGYATNDGGRAAEVTFENVNIGTDALLGREGGAYAALEETIDRAAAAVAAESLGIMNVLNDLTLEYSKTRQQFGQPIGKNQALQHRLVDMFVALEESRSLLSVYMADVDSDDATERRRAVSAMKIQIGKAGRLVGQEAIQLHGGIAMTDEYAASHYFKRMTVITRLFGDVDWHLDRFAALS